MLIEGQIIMLPGSGAAEVLFVNESRARVRLLTKTEKQIHTALGEDVTFLGSGREIDISPESSVEVIGQKEDSTAQNKKKETIQ
jgi:hypothetical protein